MKLKMDEPTEQLKKSKAKKNEWNVKADKARWKAVSAEFSASKTNVLQYLKWWEPTLTDYLQCHEFYCGIDVHKHSWRAAIFGLDSDHFTVPLLGPVCEFEVTARGRTALLEMLNYFHVKRVLMEVSGVYTYPLYDLLTDQPRIPHLEVYVMNPRQIPRDLNMIRKTDKTDAMRLARLASRSELLTSCYIENKEHRSVRGLMRFIKKKIEEKNRYENRLKGFLSGLGVVAEFSFNSQTSVDFLKAWIDSGKNRLADVIDEMRCRGQEPLIKGMGGYELLHDDLGFITLNETDRTLFGDFLSEVVLAHSQLDSLKSTTLHLMYTHPVYGDLYKRLLEVPGIGELNATLICTESGSFGRFSSMRKYQAYCGLAPTILQSGETVKHGRSYKMSNRRLFFVFKQSAMVIVNLVKRVSASKLDLKVPLYAYAKRLVDTNMVYLKAVHKVASKLNRIVFSMAISGNAYSDVYEPKNPTSVDVRDEQLLRRLNRMKKEMAYLKGRTRRTLEKRYAVLPSSMKDQLRLLEQYSNQVVSTIKRLETQALFEASIDALSVKLGLKSQGG